MFRFLMLIVLMALAALGFAWYSAQTLPDWYQSDSPIEQQASQKLLEQIQQQGASKFLGDKFADVMTGQVTFSEAEFSALFQASLQSSRDGKRLLSVSDGINAQISDDAIELGIVFNLKKISNLDARAKAKVERALDALPLLNESRVFVAIKGVPIARNGELAIGDDYSIKIGSLALSDKFLSDVGVPVDLLTSKSLAISLMTVKSVAINDGQITLDVLPRF
ncbi:MAG: hypothetical protein ACJAS9_003606 [Polaribacter sp.]|jgi:hypothetical protein